MDQKTFSHLLRTKWAVLAVTIALAVANSATAANDSYTDKLIRRPLFTQQQLTWVGNTPPSEAESKELWDAFGIGHYRSFSEVVGRIEAFIKAHPNSPWAPSLQANMGCYYRNEGYFTLALNDWQAAWRTTADARNFRGREVADFALVNWLQLLASLGRTETMKTLFEATSNRKIDERYAGLYGQYRAAYQTMLAHPEFSYRCGTYALDAVARVLSGRNYFKQIGEQPSPQSGFSMADLIKFADSNQLQMVAVDRPSGLELVVPSVVHWKQNHYAAIIGRKGNLYDVVDPTFRMDRWLNADAINSESSGQFIVPAGQIPQGWRVLTPTEATNIVGKGFPGTWYAPPCCPTGECPNPCGNSGPGSHGNGGGGAKDGNGGGFGGNLCSTCSQNGPQMYSIENRII